MGKCGKVAMFDCQIEAINKMRNGCILCGGVGSGKSRTSLAYFYTLYGGQLNTDDYVKMKNPCDLYIITTARKRDVCEWNAELIPFNMNVDPKISIYPNQKVTIDSWNNIKKYKDVKKAFFIFDEQRAIGSGAWANAFIKIARANQWVLLSATPGDCWTDYIPVFIANGFYKNRTEFLNEHAVYARFSKFPKIEKFIGTGKLERYRRMLLVDIELERKTERVYKDVPVEYDRIIYRDANRDRWDPYNNKPIENPGMLCYILRKICNSDESRADKVLELTKKHSRVIIFYNFDYELDILRSIRYSRGTVVAEWNGHKHDPVPDSEKWVYLVQYNAGCEGWNCITTNAMIFYSNNYSYKVMEQASGRIDRLNTPFKTLFYYTLKSRSNIDLSIARAIKMKKIFNERGFTKW